MFRRYSHNTNDTCISCAFSGAMTPLRLRSCDIPLYTSSNIIFGSSLKRSYHHVGNPQSNASKNHQVRNQNELRSGSSGNHSTTNHSPHEANKNSNSNNSSNSDSNNKNSYNSGNSNKSSVPGKKGDVDSGGFLFSHIKDIRPIGFTDLSKSPSSNTIGNQTSYQIGTDIGRNFSKIAVLVDVESIDADDFFNKVLMPITVDPLSPSDRSNDHTKNNDNGSKCDTASEPSFDNISNKGNSCNANVPDDKNNTTTTQTDMSSIVRPRYRASGVGFIGKHMPPRSVLCLVRCFFRGRQLPKAWIQALEVRRHILRNELKLSATSPHFDGNFHFQDEFSQRVICKEGIRGGSGKHKYKYGDVSRVKVSSDSTSGNNKGHPDDYILLGAPFLQLEHFQVDSFIPTSIQISADVEHVARHHHMNGITHVCVVVAHKDRAGHLYEAMSAVGNTKAKSKGNVPNNNTATSVDGPQLFSDEHLIASISRDMEGPVGGESHKACLRCVFTAEGYQGCCRDGPYFGDCD
eukprot:Tbor_TRINITY_DN5141_c0_g1::TRINITY_DN5141_c0_g1_i2::g.25941::m.25941